MAIADDLESRYQAKICAAFVREAATLYVERKNSKATINYRVCDAIYSWH